MEMKYPRQLDVASAIALAQTLMQQGTAESLADAKDLCLNVLAVDAGNSNACFFLGRIDFDRKNYSAALEYFQRAIKLNPLAPPLHFFLGRTLNEMGQHVEAEAALRYALSLAPQQPEFLLCLILNLLAQRNFSEALQCCDAFLRIAPDNPHGHTNRAAALAGLDRLTEAIASSRRAIDADPSDPKGYHNLAVLMHKLGLIQEAVEALRRAIGIQHDFSPALMFLGACLRSQGETRDAISQFDALLRSHPNFEDATHQLAETRQLLQLEERAEVAAGHLNPLFVLAPVARCGTTLLQRLFNSSEHMIMFGENEDVSRRLPACVGFAISKSEMRTDLSAMGSLETLLTRDWIAGLFPGRADAYLELALRNFYETVEHYQTTADKLGRRWGIKEPYAGQMGMIRHLLPRARFICIYRNLIDVARSYKARGWFESKFDVIKLAHDWQEEIKQMFLCGTKNVLVVRYENLIANPDQEIARIEQFSGCSKIDRNLMRLKVNLSEAGTHGSAVSAYRIPQALSKEENEVLWEYAGGMLKHLGYS